MKLMSAVIAVFIIVACGSPDDRAIADTGDDSDSDVTFCSCVNEPVTTDARAAACGTLLDAVTAEEAAQKTRACREQIPVPEGGPDLCFCLRTSSRDPSIREACEAIIPMDISPREMGKKLFECGQ